MNESPDSDRMVWSPSNAQVYYTSRQNWTQPFAGAKRAFDQFSDGTEARQDSPKRRLFSGILNCLLAFFGFASNFENQIPATPTSRSRRNLYVTPRDQHYSGSLRSPRSIGIRDMPGRFPDIATESAADCDLSISSAPGEGDRPANAMDSPSLPTPPSSRSHSPTGTELPQCPILHHEQNRAAEGLGSSKSQARGTSDTTSRRGSLRGRQATDYGCAGLTGFIDLAHNADFARAAQSRALDNAIPVSGSINNPDAETRERNSDIGNTMHRSVHLSKIRRVAHRPDTDGSGESIKLRDQRHVKVDDTGSLRFNNTDDLPLYLDARVGQVPSKRSIKAFSQHPSLSEYLDRTLDNNYRAGEYTFGYFIAPQDRILSFSASRAWAKLMGEVRLHALKKSFCDSAEWRKLGLLTPYHMDKMRCDTEIAIRWAALMRSVRKDIKLIHADAVSIPGLSPAATVSSPIPQRSALADDDDNERPIDLASESANAGTNLRPDAINKTAISTPKPKAIAKIAQYFGFRKPSSSEDDHVFTPQNKVAKNVGFYESPTTGRPITTTKKYCIGEAINYPTPISSRDGESTVLTPSISTSIAASTGRLPCSPTVNEEISIQAQLGTSEPNTTHGSRSSNREASRSASVNSQSTLRIRQKAPSAVIKGAWSKVLSEDVGASGGAHSEILEGSLSESLPPLPKSTSGSSSSAGSLGSERGNGNAEFDLTTLPDFESLSLSSQTSPRRRSHRHQLLVEREAREKAAREKAEAEARAARERKEAEERAQREKEAAELRAQFEREAAEQRKKLGQRRLTKEPIITPLSKDWNAKVYQALNKGEQTQVAMTSTGTSISRRDIGKVLPQRGTNDDMAGWLNDDIITAYLQAVVDHGHERLGHKRGATPRYHAFNPFFYTTLQRPAGYDGVKRWAKKAKIGGKDLLGVEFVFIPINKGGNHWTLAVVSPVRKTIEFFDSLHGASSAIITNIKSWLKGELGTAYKPDQWHVIEDEESYPGRGMGPTQDNGSDCGVFTVTTAKMIMLGIDPIAVGPKDMPLQRRRIVAELLNGGFSGDLQPEFEFV